MTPTGAEVQSRSDFHSRMTDPQQSRTHTPDPDDVRVREVSDADASDGLFRIRMPVTSTAEARDGEAFDRAKVEGFRDQIAAQRIPVFLDHGRNALSGHRYSALGKVGYLDNPEVREREAVTDVVADFVLVDPAELDGDVGQMRAALQMVRQQAALDIPLASSIGWSEDTGERDLPGDADLLEASIVGIPSDARTTTDQAGAEPALARAVATASDGFDVAEFVRALRQAEGVDTVHVPEYETAANPDGVSWDGLDLEDFDGDASPQDPVVYDKFLHSETGFPPADEADFDSLNFPVVDADGTLLFQALTDALEALPAGDLTEEEAEAMQEVIVELAAQEFPDENLNDAVTAGDLKPASPVSVDGDDDDDDRATYQVNGEAVDITPPDQVVNAAEAAQAASEDGLIPEECGTGVGSRRAGQIVTDEVGPEVVDEIAAYLTSHEEDVTADGPPTDWEDAEWGDCGNAQYAKWGGTNDGTGLRWAQESANDVARAKGEDLPYPDRNSMTQTHNLDDPEFSEGDAVEWSSNDATVRGRVADIGDEFVVGGGDVTITGDEGEAVYLIHELDDSLEPPQYRRANVAKPESSLDESQADLPPLEGNFADEENAMSDSTEPDEESGTDRDESDGMDAAEFRESMLEMQREQTDLLQTLATDMDGDDEDDEDEDDDMEEDSADAPEAEAAADAEGEERTVTLDGEERAVNEALAELREQASEAEPEEPQTQDRADEEHSEETDTTGGFGFAAVED